MKVARYLTVVIAAICVLACSAFAQQGTQNIYAQKLVDETMAKHPGLLVCAMHVTPPGKTDNVIIASNIAKIIGKKSDDDDMKVVNTSQPVLEPAKDKGRYEVLIALKDKSGNTIGALSTVFKYGDGDVEANFLKRSTAIRNGLQKRIPSVASLFKPAK